MRFVLIFAILSLACPAQARSQVPAQVPAQAAVPSPAEAAAPAADTASVDAIVAALYAVISGDRGVARDWDRFRGLFHPAARLIPTGTDRDGRAVARALTPEDYIRLSGPVLVEQGFHEREIARRAERFGGVVHLFSTYEARRAADDPEPFLRGVNSIQLFDDGARWWILTIYWQAETPALPLPPRYLPE